MTNIFDFGKVFSILKMKQLLPAFIVSSLIALPLSPLFSPIYPVFAQEDKRVVVREKIATKTAERAIKLEAVKDKVASREAMAREKIQKFKDKKRANLAERINNQLPRINTQRTTHMSDLLAKMSAILSKLETRVAEAGKNGKDTSKAQNAITEAKTAIQTAQSAVDSQAAKEYGITVTTESKIAQDSKTAVSGLQGDLKSVRELVIAAKQSVAKAISTASSSLGGKQ